MKNGYTREDARQLRQMPINRVVELLKEIYNTKLSEDCVPIFKLNESENEYFNSEMYHNSELKEAVKIAIERLKEVK